MFAFFGFVVFVITWWLVAQRLGNVGAGGLRRHLFGFLAATIVLGLCVVIAFPHTVAPEHQVALASAAPEPAAPSIKVNVKTLFQDYDFNAVTADQKYIGKWLVVGGIVQRLEKDTEGRVVAFLSSKSGNEIVVAYLIGGNDDWISTVKKGQGAVFTCRGAGKALGSPVLRSCDIVD
jgi:hypothetical protein